MTDWPLDLHGTAEVANLSLLKSEKGARQSTGQANGLGSHAYQRRISILQFCFQVACARSRQPWEFATDNGVLTKARLHRWLSRVIDRDILLVTDDHDRLHHYHNVDPEFKVRRQYVDIKHLSNVKPCGWIDVESTFIVNDFYK